MFTNPLDSIRIASPCKADWNGMYGSDKQRFCSECRMNVYNLSGMRRSEAEALIIESEGRLCVRFYRRADGTVITKDCPVGWTAIKRGAMRWTTAAASLLIGFFAGLFSLRGGESLISVIPMGDVPAHNTEAIDRHPQDFMGEPIAGEVVEYEGELAGWSVGRKAPVTRRTIREVKVYTVLGSKDIASTK